ncbi:MAG: flavin reductase family protein [Betaproteobacteria bacterium]|nr:flavin reductase family protein [Betaproteobacteria bacterium]
MEIDAAGLTMVQAYKLMTGIVVPRPIAWVTTLSKTGVVNLAPFSAFSFVSHDPPMVAISIGLKKGVIKDTGRNILDTGEFVVNIADQPLLQALHASATEFPPDVSEIEILGLETRDSVTVKPPRIAAAPVSLECVLHDCIEFGREPNRLMIGEVQRFYIRDGLVKDGKITTSELNPIARLGGPIYATLGEIITMPRMDYLVRQPSGG